MESDTKANLIGGALIASVILALIAAFLTGHIITERGNQALGEQCVAAGGSWVPGPANNYQCLVGLAARP